MAKAEGLIWLSQSLMAAGRSSLAVRHGHSSEPDQAQPQRFTVTASLPLNRGMTLMQYHTQHPSGAQNLGIPIKDHKSPSDLRISTKVLQMSESTLH